jgi:choline dehydrogenase-like flavoprotein
VVEFDDQRLEDLVAASRPVGGHHMGTTRMSRHPSGGVVDERCAVHGLPNLYACSAAVFPTCGYANPTLTVVALAIRLAAHLRTSVTGPQALQKVRDAVSPLRSSTALHEEKGAWGETDRSASLPSDCS